jgi:subtilisin family serine protease
VRIGCFPVFDVFDLCLSCTGTIQTAGSTSNTDVWSAGLSGSGQIIGIADTGLDVYSCYFYDSTCDAATGSTNCRKVREHRSPCACVKWKFSCIQTFTEMTTQVVKYISYVDNQDQETSYGGHGTHVTGSAIGECDTSYPYCSTYKLLNGIKRFPRMIWCIVSNLS